MIKGSNKERLEQEISHLIKFICDGREVFFQKTNNSISSPDKYLRILECIPLFQEDEQLIQLDLNIQLFYIKLGSYYERIGKSKTHKIKVPRNAFAHHLTDLVFKKRVRYNFFLSTVSRNFKKVKYIFYDEKLTEASDKTSKPLELNLDEDINDFISAWKNSQ